MAKPPQAGNQVVSYRKSDSGPDSEEGHALQKPADKLNAALPPDKDISANSEFLKHRLHALQESHRQQLQDMARKHFQDLEKRINENYQMTTKHKSPKEEHEPDEQNNSFPNENKECDEEASGYKAPLRSCSLSDLRKEKPVSYTVSTNKTQRPSSTYAGWRPGTVDLEASQLPKGRARQNVESTEETRNKLDEIECQKKFRALPVPAHVFLPLYQSLTDAHEKTRQENRERRREFLVSMQKPFSFAAREKKKEDEKKQDEEKQQVVDESQVTKKVKVKPIPKVVKDPGVSDRLKEDELHRKIRIQIRAQDMLSSSKSLIEVQPQNTMTRSTDKTKRAFLDEQPTFQPQTNPKVPDFNRLHKALQKGVWKKAETRDATRCQPFQLHTSRLPQRQSEKSPDTSQVTALKALAKRSQSFGSIVSLSTDTLPMFISDSTRERCAAVRRSIEEKQNQEEEEAERIRQHNLKSQALGKMVSSRAKAMDPHTMLKDVCNVKLKQHRDMDNQRMKEYRKELQDMNSRVKDRPFLFEQTACKNARSEAEQRYRNTLQQVGLDEEFVQTKGETSGETPPFTSDEEENISEDQRQHRTSAEEETKAAEYKESMKTKDV